MEKKIKKTIPLDYIRGLVIVQGGRCAITGMPLDPQDVNADHIVPLSREELAPSANMDNIWLVHKKVNAMKGTMTYAEFVEMCRAVIDHHKRTEDLLRRIQEGEIQPASKVQFDHWVEQHCQKNGKVKTDI